MRTNVLPKEVSALTLRHNLGHILDQVAERRVRFLVKRAGSPTAVVMSIQDYEDLQDLVETAFEETDPNFQKSLLEGRKAIDSGRFASRADLWKDLHRMRKSVRKFEGSNVHMAQASRPPGA